MRTLALIARRPEIERSRFREHYETVHVPLALPLLEGLTRYVRNHVIASMGESAPPFDVLTEFSYIDQNAFDALLGKLASPEGEDIARDEQTFMDKPSNVFFGVEPRGGSEIEASVGMEKVAILGRRTSGETRQDFSARWTSELDAAFGRATAWQHWQTEPMGSEVPMDMVSFAWFERASLEKSDLEAWDIEAARLWKLRVDECRT